MSSSESSRQAYYGDTLQPWDLIKALGMGADFCAGNVIKYVGRYRSKNGLDDLKKAFQKGRQIGRGELVEEQGGEMALLAEHSKLREWRRTRGFSLVPMSERFECSIVEASALERGKLVRAELVHKAQSLLANPDK